MKKEQAEETCRQWTGLCVWWQSVVALAPLLAQLVDLCRVAKHKQMAELKKIQERNVGSDSEDEADPAPSVCVYPVPRTRIAMSGVCSHRP